MIDILNDVLYLYTAMNYLYTAMNYLYAVRNKGSGSCIGPMVATFCVL